MTKQAYWNHKLYGCQTTQTANLPNRVAIGQMWLWFKIVMNIDVCQTALGPYTLHTVVKVARSSRGTLRGRRRRGVGNLAYFEHNRTLFNMDNTIFISLTSGGLMLQQRGGSNRSRGLSPCPQRIRGEVLTTMRFTNRCLLLPLPRGLSPCPQGPEPLPTPHFNH